MIKNFIKAARLRTLPLSVSGIIVGSLLGAGEFDNFSILNSSIFWLAILTTIGFQVLSNFANDYGDGIKGSDKNRTGEERMVASGVISPIQMKNAMLITTLITLIVAVLLIFKAFGKDDFLNILIFFCLGIASIVAAIKYTVGKSAYGYSGFGDLFVFLFFGLLSVAGSYFLFTKSLQPDIFLPAISIGLLSTAVLNLNNLRDFEEDQKNKKYTLVVKWGVSKAKIYHCLLIGLALVAALVYTFVHLSGVWQFSFGIAFIPLFFNILKVLNVKDLATLDSELKKVALSTFAFGILFGLAFYINL